MWPSLAGLLPVGYLCLSRSFAYLGFPAWRLFVGEIALGAFLLLKPRASVVPWVWNLLHRSPLTELCWSLVLFVGYGIFELAHGLVAGYPLFPALQSLAFHYYAFYLFLGLWAGDRYPGLLPTVVRAIAWANGVYGLLYILVLNQLPYRLPYAMEGVEAIPLFGQPGGSAVAVLGLLCVERNPAVAWPLVALNTFVLLGIQVRGEWLGFLAGMLAWGVVRRRLGRVAGAAVVLVLLLLVGFLTDFSIPSPVSRGGRISAAEIVGRLIAPVDPEAAARYSEHAGSYAGTWSWRVNWWRAIWNSVHEDAATAVAGHGYGYPITSLVPYLQGHNIRSPHNLLLYALAYGGWIGVAVFSLFQLSILRLQWRVCRTTGQAFGVVSCVLLLSVALFENFLETPHGAIPYYLLAGLGAAEIFRAGGAGHEDTGSS